LLPPVSLDEVMAFLNKRKNVIDGVVLSGGEPTLHKSLGSLITTFRERGLQVKLDTNGLNPDILQEIAFDYIAMDLKTKPAQYSDLGFLYSDCEERLIQSIGIVREMGEFGEIRIPCAPGFIDKDIAAAIGPMVKGVAKVFLQPLNYKVEFLDESYKETKGIKNEEIREYQKIIAPYVGMCTIRGE
jgi:pyruvate formate lyase activating enzyme